MMNKTKPGCVIVIAVVVLSILLYNIKRNNKLAWYYYDKDIYEYIYNARCGIFTYDCNDIEIMHQRLEYIYKKEQGSAAFDSMLAPLLRFKTEEGELLDNRVQIVAVRFVDEYDIESLYLAVDNLKDSMKTLPSDTTWITNIKYRLFEFEVLLNGGVFEIEIPVNGVLFDTLSFENRTWTRDFD